MDIYKKIDAEVKQMEQVTQSLQSLKDKTLLEKTLIAADDLMISGERTASKNVRDS